MLRLERSELSLVDWLRRSVALPWLAASCAPVAELFCERFDRSELSVVDWLRLSVAEPLPLEATCAPDALLV